MQMIWMMKKAISLVAAVSWAAACTLPFFGAVPAHASIALAGAYRDGPAIDVGMPVSADTDENEDTAAAQDQPTREPYTYTVRIFAGEKGTVDGKAVLVDDGIVPGTEKTYRWQDFAAATDSKYHPTGIRESGLDNSTKSQYVNAFTVDRDMDFVVSYAISGSETKYTIRYLEDGTGQVLHDPDEYYGNVGEKPVVSYRHIEGYVPRYRNMTGTLDEDASKNEWTFYYVANVEPEAESTTAGGQPTTAGGTGRGETGTDEETTSGNRENTATNTRTTTTTTRTTNNTANNTANTGTNNNTNAANANANNNANNAANTANGANNANANGANNVNGAGNNTNAGDAGNANGTAGGNNAGAADGADAVANADAGNANAAGGSGAGDGGNAGAQELYDIDEQGVPLGNFEDGASSDTGATAQDVNPEMEIQARSQGMPAAARAGLAVAIIAALGGAGYYFYRRYASQEEKEEEEE